MTRRGSGALVALLLLATPCAATGAQDTTTPPPPARPVHRLTFDTLRLRSFHATYDMVVRTHDSTVVIGTREIDVDTATYGGQLSWLLTDARTGAVPSAESLYVATDVHPIHWSAVQGLARLGIEFARDSMYGAVTAPRSRQSVATAAPPDMFVTSAMVELALRILPLAPGWTDSATVLRLDAVNHEIVPADLAVIGEEELLVDSTTWRPVWVVALRSQGGHSLYWVDKDDGTVRRILQPLAAHTGVDIDLRLRPEQLPPAPVPTVVPPPPLPPLPPRTVRR